MSTTKTQGDAPDFPSPHDGEPKTFDFSWVPDGEIVDFCHFVCAPWDWNCGCGRSFVGIDTCKSTTTAMVAEVDLTRDELIAKYAAHQRATWGDIVSEAEALAAATSELEFIVETVADQPVGTVVRVKCLNSDNDESGLRQEFIFTPPEQVPA